MVGFRPELPTQYTSSNEVYKMTKQRIFTPPPICKSVTVTLHKYTERWCV